MRVAIALVACVAAFTLTGCFEGPKGDKGDKGDTGTTGPAGAAGPAGSPGAPGKNFSIFINPANGTCPGADDVIVSGYCLDICDQCLPHRAVGQQRSAACSPCQLNSDGSCLRKIMNRDRLSWRPFDSKARAKSDYPLSAQSGQRAYLNFASRPTAERDRHSPCRVREQTPVVARVADKRSNPPDVEGRPFQQSRPAAWSNRSSAMLRFLGPIAKLRCCLNR